jgi:sugar phosphate isomerase/epimerase
VITRREFASALAAPGLPAPPARPRAGCQTNAWPIDGYAGFLEVLERVKAHGYAGFETGFRNVQPRFDSAAQAREEIGSHGLVFLGVHIFLGEYDPSTSIAPRDLIERVARGGAALGAQRLILSGRSISGKAERRAKHDQLGRMADFCARLDMKLAYHNHDTEFRNGEIEELLENTKSNGLQLVMDAGHAWIGGADVPEFLRRHHNRIDGMHLRDFRRRGPSPDDPDPQVPLGRGINDLKALAAAIAEAGWSGWLINEEERLRNIKPGDAAVAPARSHVRKIFGV